jgi:hypothetical protein
MHNNVTMRSGQVQGAMWYRLIHILNFVVLVTGVILTEVATVDMFRENQQDIGDRGVWSAAHEQPLVILVVLSLSAILVLTLQYFVDKSNAAFATQRPQGVAQERVKSSHSGESDL